MSRLIAAIFVFGASVAQGQNVEVARIAVTPAKPVMMAGDTLRLQGQALDAAGQPVPGARVRFQAQGGRFEAPSTR